MNNTDLEELLYFLSNDTVQPIDFFYENNDRDEKLRKMNLLMTFMNQGYAETVWETIKERYDSSLEKILENLMTLYPLSQFLVVHILNNSEHNEELLLRGLDVNEQVYTCLKSILAKMREESGGGKLTKRFEQYEQDIIKLDEQMKQLEENNAKEIDFKKQKKDKMNKIAELEKEASEENRKEVLEKLDQRINELIQEKEMFKSNYGEKQKLYDDLRNEFAAEKDRLENKEEERLIERLIKMFPKDEGGDLG